MLKNILSVGQRVCLTTSLRNINYICLNTHFISSDWNYHKKILIFCLLPVHKGEIIYNVVESCLLKWGDYVFTIAVDTSSN
jgi:hypothetical protein